MELQRVASDPGSAAGASLGLGEAVTLAETTGTAASRGETTHLAVLVDSVYYPVDLGIPADGLRKKSLG